MIKTPHPPTGLFRLRFLLLLSLSFPTIYHAQIQTDVQISMSDGVSLEARIMKPIGFPPSGMSVPEIIH